MADGALGGLGEEHASWLLVAAHNELCQRRAERAAPLLELLAVFDPDNAQGGLLLAYAYWLQRDAVRVAAVLDRLPDRAAGAARAVVERLRRGAEDALDSTPAVASGERLQ